MKYFDLLRKIQPYGPLVNSEFYPGWLTHWQEKFQTVDTSSVINTMNILLDKNCSINFYMFFGGTNFGFTAGANSGGIDNYNSDITSYDYDAPLDESGDPTPKYFSIRKAIGQHMELPKLKLPIKEPKMLLKNVTLTKITNLFSQESRNILGSKPIKSRMPLTFESINQYSGLVLYETELPILHRNPSELKINELHDRAYVYVEKGLIGILSRNYNPAILSFEMEYGRNIAILVENQGRINFDQANDVKGITKNVRVSDLLVTDWIITGFSLDNYTQIEDLISSSKKFHYSIHNNVNIDQYGPIIYYGEFFINETITIYDTYINTRGWNKVSEYCKSIKIY